MMTLFVCLYLYIPIQSDICDLAVGTVQDQEDDTIKVEQT